MIWMDGPGERVAGTCMKDLHLLSRVMCPLGQPVHLAVLQELY